MAGSTFELLALDMQGEVRSDSVSVKTDEGGKRLVRLLRDGSISVADFVLAMTIAGYGHTVSVGTATTPVTFDTGYTAAQPVLDIDVPSGWVIMPVYLLLSLETSAGTINEFSFVTGDNLVGAGTSTEVGATTILNNLNGGHKGGATNCTVRHSYTANGTAPANTVEFWRGVYAFADATTDPKKEWEWSVHTKAPQIVVGQGCLAGYIQGVTSAPTGFLKVSWLEFPSNFLHR